MFLTIGFKLILVLWDEFIVKNQIPHDSFNCSWAIFETAL